MKNIYAVTGWGRLALLVMTTLAWVQAGEAQERRMVLSGELSRRHLRAGGPTRMEHSNCFLAT